MTILIKPLVILCVGLSACGGGGNTTPSAVTPVTTPSAPADTTAPVMTIEGDITTMTITQGDTFTQPTASATDNVDGIISVSVSGSVGSDVGNYTLTYLSLIHI